MTAIVDDLLLWGSFGWEWLGLGSGLRLGLGGDFTSCDVILGISEEAFCFFP